VAARHPVAGGDDRRGPSPVSVSVSHIGSHIVAIAAPAPEVTVPAERTQRTVAVVLAAGRATRFGTTKQTADLDGRPLIGHVVAAAHAAGVAEVLVVVGHDATAVAAAAATGGPITVVTNPDYADGQATSLAAGLVAATGTGAEVAVVLLADEPDVTAAAIGAVAAAVTGPVGAARARYDDAAGHPVAFARSVWPGLVELRGDRGARDVLADLGVVEVAVAGPRPRDLDTPEALAGRRAVTTDLARRPGEVGDTGSSRSPTDGPGPPRAPD
jgi:molybdenum cofactor cytidylyltransferase